MTYHQINRIREIHRELCLAHGSFTVAHQANYPERRYIYQAIIAADAALTRNENEYADLRYFVMKAFRAMEGRGSPAKNRMPKIVRMVNFKPTDFDDEKATDFLEEFSNEV